VILFIRLSLVKTKLLKAFIMRFFFLNFKQSFSFIVFLKG